MLERATDSTDSKEPPPARREARPSLFRRPRGRIALALLAILLLILVFGSHLFDEPLRRTLEAKINQRLHGYSVTLGHTHLSLFGLSLELQRMAIRQQANPEPPVADIPSLTASVEWRQILHGHLVADAVFQHPRVHLNLPQLKGESKDEVKLSDRGWQQALESIYPLKFNHVQVREGDLVYIDVDAERPLHVSHWNFAASNIRNIQSPDRAYPSPVHSDGVIFDVGRGVVDGHADFLAEPYPGFHALYRVENVPLDRLGPIVQRANVTLSGGFASSHGEVELGPKHRQAHIVDATIRKLHVDYTHSPATAGAEEARGRKVAEAAKDTTPKVPLQVDRFALVEGQLGLNSWAKGKRYRVFLDDTALTLTGFSSGFRQGPAKASLTGRFMGSGAVKGNISFRADSKGPDFDLKAQVENANLPSINDLLQAYGKFDVAQGTFSVYTEMQVHDGHITGYVKPLFQDIDVYSAKQDKDKPALKKIYEKIVGGVSHLLENRKRDEVATVASLSGDLEDPNASNWQIFVNLVSNAFVKSILPGFEKEYEKAMARRK